MLDHLDVDGYTALSYACRFGQWQHVRTFRKSGANTSCRPQHLIWMAVGVRDYQCIKLLVHSGVGPCRVTGSDFSYTGEDLVVTKASKIYQNYIRGYLGTLGVAETMAIDELPILHGFDFSFAGSSCITAFVYCFRGFTTRQLERGFFWSVASTPRWLRFPLDILRCIMR